MKNFQVLSGQKFIDWMDNQFTFPAFKNEIKQKEGQVFRLVQAVSELPIAIYEPELVERTQFSSWWRFLQIRQYENPYINDVYLIHELSHMVNYAGYIEKYTVSMTYDDWFHYITKMELNSSLASELYVYLEYPELRALTFQQEIWADRFIKNKMFGTTDFFSKRLLAMIAPIDDIEKGIAKYRVQNEKWAEIWNPVRHDIDGAMVNLFTDRNAYAWLEFVNYKKNNGNVSFPFETMKFHDYIKSDLITLHKV